MSESEQHGSFLGCFSQIFRILVGPALILLMGTTMITNRTNLGGPLDFIFGGIVLATVLATFVESKYSTRTPAEGDRASSGRARYVLIVLAVSVAMFVVAHFVIPKVF